MTSMAKRRLSPAAGLVCNHRSHHHMQFTNPPTEDPAEFFSMIFGGDAFVDWIGEIALMKDLTKTMDISMKDAEEKQAAEDAAAAAGAPEASGTSGQETGTTGTAGPFGTEKHAEGIPTPATGSTPAAAPFTAP